MLADVSFAIQLELSTCLAGGAGFDVVVGGCDGGVGFGGGGGATVVVGFVGEAGKQALEVSIRTEKLQLSFS